MVFGVRSGFALKERRKSAAVPEQHSKKLRQFQMDRVSDLIHMGASLLFVRNAEMAPLAVLEHGHTLLTVDHHGLIQSDPDLRVR
ncbi:hypothetical protein GCM10011369_33910 [Neiella marina]|uniref:Uncharacterized protein n=1 Tax=Neiella marina TaxID=508461 RepID=A0A8J2XPR4_9GAMM|nr:hypothetical protein [Neiella marina]GGA88973.1 hypothetical protein GCM10011369_33910 [Neiella marina]